MDNSQNGKLTYDNWDSLNGALENCRICPRLVDWREEVSVTKRKAYRDMDYWGKPVPGFGDHQARIMIVGLAPGAHGSNRTGRMFTGDASGDFLFPALYRAGFANQPHAESRDDDLELKDIFITAVGRCAPPQNKIKTEEIINCRSYLLAEMQLLDSIEGFVALGNVAFSHLVKILDLKFEDKKPKFGHGVLIKQENTPWLMGSYHPSRQNTQTGRLTVEMFDSIWEKARNLLDNPGAGDS